MAQQWRILASTLVVAWAGTGCENTVAVPALGGTSDGASDDGAGASAEQPEVTDPDPTQGGADEGQGDTDGPQPQICGDGIRTGGEACDRTDLGGATCSDFGVAGTLTCTSDCELETCGCEGDVGAGCGPDPDPVCGNGQLERGEACEGSQFAGWEEPVDCAAVLGSDYYGPLECVDCTIVTEACGSCGDGTVQLGRETCDPAQPHTLSCAEVVGPMWSGVLTCTDSCAWDPTGCVNSCGNGELDPTEACDGAALGGQTCLSQGYLGGVLACSASCTLWTAGCDTCGDGIADPGEACDGADLGGATCLDFVELGAGPLTCDDDCTIIADACQAPPLVWDGEAVITEIMVASLADPGFNPGEWFEVHNPSPDLPFDLLGCLIQGAAPFETVLVDLTVPIPPGGYVTLGRGTDAELGFTPDYYLPPQVTLLNGGDTLQIECGGIVRDVVIYGVEDPWPTFQAGVAIATEASVNEASANDAGTAWCSAPTVYGLMQQGTPGSANDCAP